MKSKSDAQIQTDVTNELRWEPCVTHESIGVAVHKGVVTLTGSVPTYAEKMATEKAAMRVGGVKGIAEEIEVRVKDAHKRNDTEIAEAATSSLQWHVWAPETVKAKVQKGWVTLSGEVPSEFQRNAAANSVRFLAGVTGISNDIKLKTKVKPQNVKKKIEEALVRDAKLEAKYVHVLAEGSSVTLTGDVHTYFEKHAAATAAYRAEGVCLVKNDIRVV